MHHYSLSRDGTVKVRELPEPCKVWVTNICDKHENSNVMEEHDDEPPQFELIFKFFFISRIKAVLLVS